MALLTGPIRVRVPATSANLGPGFDSLGLALARHDEIEARIADDGVRVDLDGEGVGDLPGDESHLVARAMRVAFDALGEHPAGLRLRCVNAIPQARGLGSSSAAIVGGLLAARALVAGGPERLDDDAVLSLAVRIEGHPDNVAPCLLGGFTIAWGDRAVRLEPSPGFAPVVFVPPTRGLTALARAALPPEVPHADAAFNAGRAALLVHAITSAPELLLDATEDRLHQNYRAAGMPESSELVTKLRAAGVPAVISGAGPAVLALVRPADAVPEIGGEWVQWRLRVDATGADVGAGTI
jgi:homoserine kinase